MDNSKKLSLVQPLLFLSIFVIIVLICVGVLSYADNIHKETVLDTYTKETNSYINSNKDTLLKLFAEGFPNTTTCYQNGTNPNCIKPDTSIISALPSSLKDWSSTFFIKQVNGRIFAMRLSGDVTEENIYPEENKAKIVSLLYGNVESIPWDQYSYILGTKEVIIPVKDKQNKVVGAIVRGVIE